MGVPSLSVALSIPENGGKIKPQAFLTKVKEHGIICARIAR
jgi:hypothetical protein